jgi:hypothetical protein
VSGWAAPHACSASGSRTGSITSASRVGRPRDHEPPFLVASSEGDRIDDIARLQVVFAGRRLSRRRDGVRDNHLSHPHPRRQPEVVCGRYDEVHLLPLLPADADGDESAAQQTEALSNAK